MAMRFSWKGCLIGCGAVILLFIVFLVGTGVWLTKKGDFEEAKTILTEDAEFFVRANLRSEDVELIKFLANQSRRLNEVNPMSNNFPMFYKEWQHKQTQKDLKKMLPLEIELTGQQGADDFRAAVGFSLYNNMARVAYWFLKRNAANDGNLMEANGIPFVALVEEENTFYLSLWQNILYFSGQREGVEGMLGDQGGVDHQAHPLLQDLDLETPIYGFAVGKAVQTALAGELVAETEEARAAQDAFFNELRRVGFNMFLKDEETIAGSVVLDLPPSDEYRQVLEYLLATKRDEFRLEFNYELTERATGYKVTYTLTGMGQIFDEMGESLNQQF